MIPPDSRIAREEPMNSKDGALRKTLLRANLLPTRSALKDADREAATSKIGAQVLQWARHRDIKTLAVYSPIRGEPDLTATWSALADAGIELALPIVVADDAPLEFVGWHPGQPMIRDRYGISVPAQPRQSANPTTMLIPCLGFTAQRLRLGYGGGFYDRTLAAFPLANTVGIAFDCCRVSFDAQVHDIALQAIITESGIY